MIYNSYVVYQSIEAANAIMLAQEMLPYELINFNAIHYISDETAMANLDLAEKLSALRSLAK